MTKMFVYITRERSIERQLLLNIIMQNFSILSLPLSLRTSLYSLCCTDDWIKAPDNLCTAIGSHQAHRIQTCCPKPVSTGAR